MQDWEKLLKRYSSTRSFGDANHFAGERQARATSSARWAFYLKAENCMNFVSDKGMTNIRCGQKLVLSLR